MADKKPAPKKGGSKISNHEWGMAIGALLLIDLVEVGLDLFFDVGAFVNPFIDVVINLAWPTYLHLRGVDLKSQKVLITLILGALLQEIPDLDGFWALEGFVVMLAVKSEELIKKETGIDVGKLAAKAEGGGEAGEGAGEAEGSGEKPKDGSGTGEEESTGGKEEGDDESKEADSEERKSDEAGPDENAETAEETEKGATKGNSGGTDDKETTSQAKNILDLRRAFRKNRPSDETETPDTIGENDPRNLSDTYAGRKRKKEEEDSLEEAA